jgi:catechol 2,3-dioxygenase-like lactoylglutathione lyase family enzyme
MITGLSHSEVFALDQDRAKAFYTEKLGLEVRNDFSMGDGFEGGGAGFRWLTVGIPGHPQPEIILADCAMGHDPETAEQLWSLVAKGVFGCGVLMTDDCRRTHEELSSRGVVFLQEPAERPYGIEAVFRDDSGNWFSLTQPRWMAAADASRPAAGATA